MAERVARLKADWVSISAASLGTFTIGLCYYLAVSLGHVPAWLPMISDCAVNAPEKYPFRIGMIVSPCLIFVNASLYYFFVGGSAFGGRRVADKVALILCGISSVGLMVVGAVNEQEDNSIHSAGALVFFIAQWIFQLLSTLRLRGHSTKLSIYIKSFVTAASLVALVLFAYYSGNWGEYKIRIAICEWSGVLLIMVYHLSFASEFRDEYVCELINLSSTAHRTSSPSSSPSSPAIRMNNIYVVPSAQQQHMRQYPPVYYHPVPSVSL